MPSDLPCPGQVWGYANIQVTIVAVGPDAVRYRDLSEPAGMTCDNLQSFLEVFHKLVRPAKGRTRPIGTPPSGASWSGRNQFYRP